MNHYMSTQILVDNSDPNIQYSPGWASKTSSLQPGTNGYPIYGTSQETDTQAEFSFSYVGTSVTIYGSIIVAVKPSLTFICFVDDVDVGGNDVIGFNAEGANIFCGPFPDLPEGQHEVRLSVKASQNQSFLFDYLLYTPSSALPSANVFLPSDNPNFEYGNGWELVTSEITPVTGMETESVGSQFTFNFYGVSILWIGRYNFTIAASDHVQTLMTYSVDGGSPMEVSLDSSVAQGLNKTNPLTTVPLFETFAYTRGQHSLEVIFKGAADASGQHGIPIPLSLAYLVVRNGTATPSASPSQTSSPTTRPGGMKAIPKIHLAATLGSCLAAVLVIIVLITFVVCRRMKRRKYASADSGTSSRVEPFSRDCDPAFAPAGPYQKGHNFPEHQGELNDIEPSVVGPPPSYLTRRSSI
ncbi:hypothetical protein GALMADRAFT_231209 [Galerina marginata CBS 339.88]|uniref:Uncharacterized protein n=1 Tax=Galerina marginata (strain CBS 339.88) TaxID=685588 RepID=A0A067SCE1_GALM3|nr:hypothetical protein GALMADRAFT_231209 [Galerina marginata CBS 339.88]